MAATGKMEVARLPDNTAAHLSPPRRRGAAWTWSPKQPAIATPSTQAARDPFAQSPYRWRPVSTPSLHPASSAELWPRGRSAAAARWRMQASESIREAQSDGCVIEDDKPFVAGSQSTEAPITFDSDGRRIVWPWEVEGNKQSGFDAAEAAQQSRFVEMPQLPPHRTDKLIQRGLDASTASGSMGKNTTGVRAWHVFCHAENISPNRALDPNSCLEAKLVEEQLCMRFCAALVQDRGVQPKTVQTYFGHRAGIRKPTASSCAPG